MPSKELHQLGEDREIAFDSGVWFGIEREVVIGPRQHRRQADAKRITRAKLRHTIGPSADPRLPGHDEVPQPNGVTVTGRLRAARMATRECSETGHPGGQSLREGSDPQFGHAESTERRSAFLAIPRSISSPACRIRSLKR